MNTLATTRMSSKGQIVIPEVTRKVIGLRTGTNYHPHLTVGIGTRDFVDALQAEPFQPFPVRADVPPRAPVGGIARRA